MCIVFIANQENSVAHKRVITPKQDRDWGRNGVNLVVFVLHFFSKNPGWLAQDRFITYNC